MQHFIAVKYLIDLTIQYSCCGYEWLPEWYVVLKSITILQIIIEITFKWVSRKKEKEDKYIEHIHLTSIHLKLIIMISAQKFDKNFKV